jgi:hypothetical protein
MRMSMEEFGDLFFVTRDVRHAGHKTIVDMWIIRFLMLASLASQ